MEYLETEGETIDAAIEKAVSALGVERDKITVDILSQGRKGILGFGGQKARIRASLRKSGFDVQESDRSPAPGVKSLTAVEAAAMGEKAKEVLSEILRLMGIDAAIELKAGDDPEEAILEIRTANSGLVIGRKGQTLEALQYLMTRILGERPGDATPHFVVDIENYRQRRHKSLQDMALRLGEKAKRQRKTVTVDALSAADRKVIHAALQDDPWLTTRSLGQGLYRRLLIIPEGDRKKKTEEKLFTQERKETKASDK
jgi:spoIIIJ-associated protein